MFQSIDFVDLSSVLIFVVAPATEMAANNIHSRYTSLGRQNIWQKRRKKVQNCQKCLELHFFVDSYWCNLINAPHKDEGCF